MVAPTAQSPVPPAAAPAPAVPCPLSPVPSPLPLPPLPPSDRHLLLRLLALKEDFEALAAELAAQAVSPSVLNPLSPVPLDLLDLLAWSTRPDIAAWIAYFRQTKDHQRRELALDALESIVKAPDNKTELRRAATTLLRALDHRWPRERAARSSSDGPPDPPPPPRPPLVLPKPTMAPSVAHTPDTLVDPIISDLIYFRPKQALANIRAASNNPALTHDDDLLTKLAAHMPLPHLTGPEKPVQEPPTPDGVQRCLIALSAPGRRGLITFHFTRPGPKTPWGISAVDTG